MQTSHFKERINLVYDESERLKNLGKISSSLWEIETDLYETQEDDDDILDFTNFDFRSFPYHKALYPLLDYVFTFFKFLPLERLDLLERNNRRLPSFVFDTKRRVDRELELKIVGYFPCSAYSILKSLVPLHRARHCRQMMEGTHTITLSENEPRSTSFDFLEEWLTELLIDEWKPDRTSTIVHRQYDKNEVSFSDDAVGPENIEPDKRFDVLSRILRHSLSSMQRDHRLARSVLLLMIEYKCLDDEENLRILLVVLASDTQQCNSNCHSDYIENFGFPENDTEELIDALPQHYCNDFQNYQLSVRHVLAYGMSHLSNTAVNIFLAFVNTQIDPFSASKLGGPIPYDEWREDVDGISWIQEVIGALHSQGCMTKHKMVASFRRKYSASSSDDDHILDDSNIMHLSDSYDNCVRCLVYIGETFIHRLEPSHAVAVLGGYIVKALITTLNSEYFPFNAFSESQYLGSYGTFGTRRFPNLLSINRYSDLITLASEIPNMRLKETQDLLSCRDPQSMKDNPLVKKVFLSPLSKEIYTVVRGLFLRNFVDVTCSCCGYGDFLVWSRLPISCHDKLLYYHGCNFPDNDEDIEPRLWGHFGEGPALRSTEIAARYDFSLLALKSAWQKPWSFTSHRSFSSTFHQAIWTLSLCASRKKIPVDLFPSIFEFIPRSWFLDHGQDCWVAICQIKHLNDDLRGIVKERNFAGVCPNCNLACACSTQHALDIMYKEGHKRLCGLGPLRRYGFLEQDFCRRIMLNASCYEGSSCEDQGSEDSSWESIDSEQEARLNLLDDRTRQMISFFAKDHKLISEDSDFNNFLRTRDGDDY